MNAKSLGVSSVIFVLPWCCILPAGFAVLGLAGTAVLKTTLMEFAPLFLMISVGLLGWSNYLIHIKKQGNRASRVVVCLSTLLTASIWIVWVSLV
jgi:surface polysaccharide O-acyltransferase-like enzyme